MRLFPAFAGAFLALINVAYSHEIVARSTENGPCTGAGGAPGVCVATSKCSSAGGTYISNACPGTPEDIKCCTKTSCGSSGGNCRWTSQCASGLTESNLCPGPTDFKCCLPGGSTNLGQQILAKAKTAAGTPYVWAGGSCSGPTGSPTKGFDCSGLVSWAVCSVTGRNLFSEGLRVTSSMYCASEAKLKYKKVTYLQRRAGDAVFFGGGCDCSKSDSGVHHVGLMMDSGTRMWNALKTGTNVREDDFGSWSEKPCPYVIRFQ
ncbi:hypothetical protein GQ53DRAFT_802273 [Thozetella sp. PMI_491]|nr:hypothetical protein GQ53DRAFT_802273 [Thozetella sp. PMI_491]